MRKTKIGNKSKEDWILDILKVIVLSIVTIITVYPFWNIFIISINDATDAIRGGLYFLPRKLSFSSYLEILTKKTFLSSIKVSVARTVIGTPIAVLVTSMLAYALSRRDLVGRKFWNLLFIFTMYFGGGLVPYYMVLKGIHMLNTFWVFIFPLMMSVYNMILVRSYVESMPESLFEAAKIDGATAFQRFRYITMPFLLPTVTVNLVLTIKQGFTSFDFPFALTGGGPVRSTEVIGVLIYNDAFKNLRFSVANAEACLLFLVVAVFSLTQLKLTSRGGGD